MIDYVAQGFKSVGISALLLVIAGCSVTRQKDSANQESNPFEFQRALSWNSDSFEVSSSRDKVTIKTPRETLTDTPDGVVTGAEVGDLNNDGYPEILVFVTSVGSGSYGSVIGYSSNEGKSMSRMNTALATEDPKYMDGYMGHDKFSVIEGTLVQAFPVYRKGDFNAAPTGPTRQIRYTMVDGEAARKLVVGKVVEYK